VEGTLLDFDRAAYVLGLEGSRPLDRAALAGSILQNGDGGGDGKTGDEPSLPASLEDNVADSQNASH
jgi:hypothetical protein